MRWLAATVLMVVLLMPTMASARVDHRCWLSFGVVGGPAVHTEPVVKDEFNVGANFDLEVKHYLWKPFSLAASFGALYAEGRPDRLEWHGEWTDLHGTGVSFWRAYPMNLLLRVEFGRYWLLNPYIGGGAGGVYNSVWRKGPYKGRKISDSYEEWLIDYTALAGMDYLFNKFAALRLEGRWTWMPSNDTFIDKRDMGYWSALIGLQIYL